MLASNHYCPGVHRFILYRVCANSNETEWKSLVVIAGQRNYEQNARPPVTVEQMMRCVSFTLMFRCVGPIGIVPHVYFFRTRERGILLFNSCIYFTVIRYHNCWATVHQWY